MTRSRCRSVSTSLVLMALAGCGPRETTIELEIVDVRPATPTIAAGDVVSLQVQVRNNGPGTGTVCAAVTTPDTATGLIRKGPAVDVGPGRTETLTLDVPADRDYVKACTLATNVFLARPTAPGAIGNLAQDKWLDAVENDSRDISFPLTRPVPTALQVVEPIQDVHDPSDGGGGLLFHLESTAHVLPEGSAWAMKPELVVQTQTAQGQRLTRHVGRLMGDRLRSTTVRWDGSRQEHDSMARATVRGEAANCAGETIVLLAERIAVRLAPR